MFPFGKQILSFPLDGKRFAAAALAKHQTEGRDAFYNAILYCLNRRRYFPAGWFFRAAPKHLPIRMPLAIAKTPAPTMLTATYSLIALSIEQRKARSSFAALEQNVRMRAIDAGHADETELEEMVHQLSRFDRYCHERKVETCLIPALRRSEAAGVLLSELDSLLRREAGMLHALQSRLGTSLGQGAGGAKELCHTMEHYCSSLSERLHKEEQLLDVAERLIPGDEWFAIASSFLSPGAQEAPRRAV